MTRAPFTSPPDSDLPADLQPLADELRRSQAPIDATFTHTSSPPEQFVAQVRARLIRRRQWRRGSVALALIAALGCVLYGMKSWNDANPAEQLAATDSGIPNRLTESTHLGDTTVVTPGLELAAEPTLRDSLDSQPDWIELSESDVQRLAQGLPPEHARFPAGQAWYVIPVVSPVGTPNTRRWFAVQTGHQVVTATDLAELDQKILRHLEQASGKHEPPNPTLL